MTGAATTRFAYDSVNTIAEYDGSNALQRRFVFGPGVDQPIVHYEGSGTSSRRFQSSDERGSIIAATDSSGALLSINSYDEYGKPSASNIGRFQYTGQRWIGEIGAYDYKARVYLPHLGIFAQTDPHGYNDSTNSYLYALADPTTFVDPMGLDVTCTGSRIPRDSCGGTPGLSCIGECNNFLSSDQRNQLHLEDRFGEVREARAAPIYFDLLAFSACAADPSACLASDAAQSEKQGYFDFMRFSTDKTRATLRAINNDPDVMSAARQATSLSIANRREYGFWIGQNGRDYYAGPMLEGIGPNIWPFLDRLTGSNIFLHIHPFINRPQGLSICCDRPIAANARILIISVSYYGWDWADFRR